jgi:hypothetical protein
LERLSKGQWERAHNIGISKINLGDYYKIYLGDKAVDIDTVNKMLEIRKLILQQNKTMAEAKEWSRFHSGIKTVWKF